jgi:hypothetical protein
MAGAPDVRYFRRDEVFARARIVTGYRDRIADLLPAARHGDPLGHLAHFLGRQLRQVIQGEAALQPPLPVPRPPRDAMNKALFALTTL